jgi:hypothetical protein
MDAEMLDFQLVREDEEIVAFQFRFGQCEDWTITFGNFKGMIPLEDRTPYKERNWLWEVKDTPYNRQALSEIFDNFEQCLDIATRQMRMF